MIKDLKDGMLATGVYLVKDFIKCCKQCTNFMNIILQVKAKPLKARYGSYPDTSICFLNVVNN